MNLIDGKVTSAKIREELRIKVETLINQGKSVPGLVAILVGDNSASKIYVESKEKACREVGMLGKIERLSADISEQELLDIVESYNNNNEYHGILVQLPLPKHIDETKVIEAINPSKDVDGFHPVSVGNLVIGNDDALVSCTPAGIFELLKRYNIDTKGKHVVVVGRSNIVGKPIANIMLQKKDGANSIVTVCHSAAKNIEDYTRTADILIAAIGVPEFIKADMVKEGVVIIDVGINRVDDPSSKKGYRVVGDVAFEEVKEKASFITPVPGGVGPMTIAMLLSNTLKAYLKINNL